MATPHILANEGDFSKTVLMPGDPLRSKFIAENFLTDAKLVNNIRGVQGYTGYYNGKRVSVMASGMGQPSIGIYSYELYNSFGVENIIRVGSCGSFDPELNILDIVLAMGACTAVGGDVATDAFGVVAMVAMTPLITIQILGLVYKLKQKKEQPLPPAPVEEIIE